MKDAEDYIGKLVCTSLAGIQSPKIVGSKNIFKPFNHRVKTGSVS